MKDDDEIISENFVGLTEFLITDEDRRIQDLRKFLDELSEANKKYKSLYFLNE